MQKFTRRTDEKKIKKHIKQLLNELGYSYQEVYDFVMLGYCLTAEQVKKILKNI